MTRRLPLAALVVAAATLTLTACIDVGSTYTKAAIVDIADGALLVSPCVPAPTSGDFAAAYDSEYQAMPGPYAAEGYDATNVLLDAIAAGKRTRADVLAFVKTYDHRGVTKTIRFDATGELVPSELASWLFKVNGTQLVPDRPLTTT